MNSIRAYIDLINETDSLEKASLEFALSEISKIPDDKLKWIGGSREKLKDAIKNDTSLVDYFHKGSSDDAKGFRTPEYEIEGMKLYAYSAGVISNNGEKGDYS